MKILLVVLWMATACAAQKVAITFDDLPLNGALPAGVRIAGPSIRIVRNHPAYIERLKRNGHRVHVWTVNEPEDVDLCVELGIDAIITNRPAAILSRLGR